jgi:hypothetical protein
MTDKFTTGISLTLSADQRGALLDDLYTAEHACRSIGALVAEMRSISPVPFESESNRLEIGVTLEALILALEKACEGIGDVIGPAFESQIGPVKPPKPQRKRPAAAP